MKFKQNPINMGSADRIARMFSAILIIAVYASGILSSLFGIALLVASFFFMVTSLSGFCPVYSLIHISTLPVE